MYVRGLVKSSVEGWVVVGNCTYNERLLLRLNNQPFDRPEIGMLLEGLLLGCSETAAMEQGHGSCSHEMHLGMVADRLSCRLLVMEVKLFERERATGDRGPLPSLVFLGEFALLLGVRGSLHTCSLLSHDSIIFEESNCRNQSGRLQTPLWCVKHGNVNFAATATYQISMIMLSWHSESDSCSKTAQMYDGAGLTHLRPPRT